MTILRTVEIEKCSEPNMVALVERDACARVMQRIAMTAEAGSHIGFELARRCVELLKKERTS